VVIPTFAMKGLRQRYAVGGAKSDPGDAYVIADVARTDGHRLRRLDPPSEQTRALRSVVRARDDLVDQRVALGNQLRSWLAAYWPGAAMIFADVCSKIALAFVERYPAPEFAARRGEVRLGSSLLLKKAGYRGRRTPVELLEQLRSASTAVVGVETEARADAVRAMVRVMRSLNGSIKDLARRSSHTSVSTRTSRSSRRCHAPVGSTPPRCSPSGATCVKPTPEPDAVAMLEGLCRLPTHRASTGTRAAAGLRRAAPGGSHHLRRQLPARLAVAAETYRRAMARGLRSPARCADPG
jgi:hypothetical protein